MIRVNPYLNFSGDCEEAFEFYRSVFGGEFSDVSRYDEMPDDPNVPSMDPHKIMHIALPVGDGQVLMGSDRPDALGPTSPGDNVQISINPTDGDESRRIFNGLAQGGAITMPYERAFWGADFGMCTDKYGVHWMVNHDPNEST